MSTTPYYGPDESPSDIFLERTFVAGDFVCGVGYGMQIILYIYCGLYLWSQRRSPGKKSMLLLAYMSLLLAVETIFVIVQAMTVQDIYVDNRNYPGGPWAYFLATQYKAINVMFYATLFVLTFLSDLLVLWRCWVIWTAAGPLVAYAIMILPGLMLVASFVMGTLWTLQSSQPGLSLYSALPMAYGTSYYIISLSVNIVLTFLITLRLLMYRHQALKVLPEEHTRHYFSLATIIVESAALYTVFALLFIITYAVNNPINQIFLAVASNAQQIASYLIIYRVADGRAWSQKTFSTATRQRETLKFASLRTTAGIMSGTTDIDLESPTSEVKGLSSATTSSALPTPLQESPSLRYF